MDFSSVRIQNCKLISDKINTYVLSAENLDAIADNSIDLYISTQVMEHVDDKAMISEIGRVCKKGALIYITTVYKKPWAWYYYKNDKGCTVLDPTHLREYTADEQLLSFFDPKRYNIIHNQKEMHFFPVVDFFLRRLPITNFSKYNNAAIKMLRYIKLPIFGYYEWTIVLRKE